MKIHNLILVPVLTLMLAACGQKSIEGEYNLTGISMPGVVATFGKNTFSLSSGASGTYEVSGDNVILSGETFSGTFKITGKTLVGPQGTLTPRDPNDKSAVNLGPRGMSDQQPAGPVKSTNSHW